MKILDLFAGAGGWDVAATRLGHDVERVEIWDRANRTAEAAGLTTVHHDVTTYTTEPGRHTIQLGSPSCKRYSAAGNGAGRKALEHVLAGVEIYAGGGTVSHEQAVEMIGDADAALTLEPLRIALEGRPWYIAWEQTPAVLPVWQACARVLERHGYSVATGILNAEQYGVPQTRRRAVLMARTDGPVALPVPTHSRFWNRSPERLDDGVKPWVSMAEALHWDERAEVISNYGTGGDPAARGVRTSDQPFATVTGKADRFKIHFRQNAMRNATVRTENQPAPTITGAKDWRERVWMATHMAGAGITGEGRPRDVDHPAPTLTGKGTAAWMNGANRWRAGLATEDRTTTRKVEPREVAILQTFPADYPWQGGKSEVMTQIGNAVPPLLAEAILTALTT
jgi:DNA (cytosine-5)-methyltransferase 1